MNLAEKRFLWRYRLYGIADPRALPKFLQCVPWNQRRAVVEAHHLLRHWVDMDPIAALELLDAKFADAMVREYAVRCLEGLNDEELAFFLLQLIQVLKYELYHDSALARFLVRRAWLNTHLLGHAFFWALRAELHVAYIRERYGLLLEDYLRGCSVHRGLLRRQVDVVNQLAGVAQAVREAHKEERKQVLMERLGALHLPPVFQLPLSQRFEACGLIPEKCRVMDSKKLPLWLTFTNPDPQCDPIVVLFKCGDDIRQDQLTLQMIRIMDKIWRRNGLDLRLKPYLALATGDNQGFLEIVLNSKTTAHITKESGGATAAFSETPLAEWLRSKNSAEADYEKAVENFAYSCAGYCCATYVLGIGDRHNDNIMMTNQGHLFHIDFGHFLGNFKKVLGVKRESAPFVFTPDYAYVLGGKDARMFKRFEELSQRAYNILRRHAHMFINLFAMMLSTGIPELQSEDDIRYMENQFSLDFTDEQAAQKFSELIRISVGTTRTQLNNYFHIMAH
eukprot:GAFH01001155.1.p1 GENE.GAFH01001155.1~~GAFH01001155.1.p1  ORF type:complete len:549 (+),score=288.11 GAFH01001155.1:132-1649(+)